MILTYAKFNHISVVRPEHDGYDENARDPSQKYTADATQSRHCFTIEGLDYRYIYTVYITLKYP